MEEMKDKDLEKQISDEFESPLPDSGLSFEDLSSKVDFSVYKKKRKPLFRRPWVIVFAAGLAVIAVAGTATVAIIANGKYNETGYVFNDGEYAFAQVLKSNGEAGFETPKEGDSFIIGKQPVGDCSFQLTEASAKYEGYLSIVGTIGKYEISAKKIYSGIIDAMMTQQGVQYSLRISAMKYYPVIYLEIASSTFSYTSVFRKK